MPEATFAGPNAAIQLVGALKTGTAVLAAATPFERIYTAGVGKVEAIARVSAISATATCTINLYGIHPPARMDGNEGTRTSAPLASATLANNVETKISAVPVGFQFVDLEVAPGASSGLTLGPIRLYTAGPST